MIKISNVTTQYGGDKKLNIENLNISQGDFFVIFGKDGSGKTTLLHLIMGFELIKEGKISLFDKEPNRISTEDMNKVRFVPDDLIWEKNLTGEEYLNDIKLCSASYSEALKAAMCDKFNLDLKKKIGDMDETENKCLQIIGAVAVGPRLLILDEPMNFLTDDYYNELLIFLDRFNRSGMTILIVTENLEDMNGFGKNYLCLNDGAVISSGEIPSTIEAAKKVTVFRNGVADSYIYKGDVTKIGAILKGAGATDWTIENISFKEELEMSND